MRNANRCALFANALLCAAVLAAAAPSHAQKTSDRDRIWIHRNLGAAYFADESFTEAAKEMGAVAALSEAQPGDHRNAGIAFLLAKDYPAAHEALERARSLEPSDPRTAYALGILAKRESNLEAARAAFLDCRKLGGSGPELDYNLGIVESRLNNLEAAEKEFRAAVELGPNNAPRHYASSLYRLGRTLIQRGQREEGAKAMASYQELVKAGEGAQLSEEDLERGPLLELTELARPPDVRAAGPLPAFKLEAIPAGDIRWAVSSDFDQDGDSDLLLGDGQTLHDLRKNGAKYTDVTSSRGLSGILGVTMARVQDMDNDGRLDLVRAGGGGVYVHPGIEGGWDPPIVVTKTSSAAFQAIDLDHEGDLDVLSLTPAGINILRNNGDRTFTDITPGSGFEETGPCMTAAAGDLDDDQDIDVLILTRKGRVHIASNLRGGHFQVQPAVEGAPENSFEALLGDFDNDGDLDVALAGPSGASVLRNEGSLKLARVPGDAAIPGAILWPSPGAVTLWARDLDNDGRLDLIAARDGETIFALNEGDMSFSIQPDPVRVLNEAHVTPAAILLADEDGKLDILASKGSLGLARNIGRTGASLVLHLTGVENNVDGVGAIVEVLSGPRALRRDGGGGLVHFGIGENAKIDALRVRWPNGIRQSVMAPKPDSRIEIKEKPGLVGSCPFLYAWNGVKHEFITDILTVTPLGLPVMPGTYVPPNWDEVIRATAAQLQPNDSGDLVLQVTEELREVTYLDQARLYAIDHPRGTEVQPNEKFKFPPFPEFGVHVLDGARAPLTAIDHRGRNVVDELLETDDEVVGDLQLTHYPGIVEMHSLTLDFGDVPPDAPLMLHLTGWFYWTNASINLSLYQDPRYDFIPPFIEVQDSAGQWEKLPVEVGFPGGKTKSIPVDLSGAFPDGHAKLRITTSLRIYWDRALLQVGKSTTEPRVTMILPYSADLHERGHSEPIFSRTGESPERFDYDVMRSGEVPWNQHPGMYTKHGDITPLLQEPDDMYAIMASGDECTLKYRAADLPELGPDQERTYFLFFDGWAKDGDLNTTWSETVEPLPFHAMSGYPYAKTESYPQDEAHQEYLRTWNTRPAKVLLRDFQEMARTAADGLATTE